MNCWQVFKVLLLCCLGTLTPIRAATITGTLRNITGAVHPDKRVVFTPVDTPRNLPNGSVLWTPTQVTSVNGVFTVVLGPGHYRVSIDGIVWAYRCVPDSEDTFTFNSADIMCHSGTGIYLSTNQLYKVLTSTNDGFPSYLYSSLLAGTNIFLEDIDDGSGTNRVVKINSSGGGRTGNTTQFDDDGSVLTITNIHGVAGATLWTNSAGTLQPIDLTAQPLVHNGWFIGTNSAGIHGAMSSGESIVSIRDVAEGEPDYGGVIIGTKNGTDQGMALLETDSSPGSTLHLQSTTAAGTRQLSAEANATDFSLRAEKENGDDLFRLEPDKPDGETPYIFDTSISQTLGPLLSLRNNTVDALKFGPGAQIGFGVGDTNVLSRNGERLRYANDGASGSVYIEVKSSHANTARYGVNSNGDAALAVESGKVLFLTPNGAASGSIVVQAAGILPDTDDQFDLGADASNGAFQDLYMKGVAYVQGLNDGVGNRSRLEIDHDNSNITFDSTALGTGTPRDFLWQSNGVTVAKIALNSGYAGGGTKYLDDSGVYSVPSGGGGASDNWVASGVTNSTLPGIGSANALIGTNGVYAGNGFYAPWWTASADDTFVGVHDVSAGDSDYSFFYVGNVDNGAAEENYADLSVTLTTTSASPSAIFNLAAVATNLVSTFSVNLQPDQGVARIDLVNGGDTTFNVEDDGTINSAAAIVAAKAFQSHQGTLTHAGTVTLDFDAATTVNTLSLTGSVTFAFSNVATNRTLRLRVINPQATNITITLPSGVNTSTNWIGGKPGSMTAGTVALWSAEAWGATDGDVLSAWGDAF